MFNRKKATDLPVPSWKKKIDDLEFKKTQEEQRRLQEQKALEDAEKKAYENQKQNELNDKIRILGQNFQCHVCERRATKPGQDAHSGTDYGEHGIPSYYTYHTDNWSYPGDLFRCSICEKWTCTKCLHKTICKSCAEKL